jgi:micrococcal nuclease
LRAAGFVALVGLAGVVISAAFAGSSVFRVSQVVDGDTLDLRNGSRVRLVQIDTPELGTAECYSRAAARELQRLLPEGSAVRLEADSRLDQVDRYGRLLRYAHRGAMNVNLELVKRGAATVWFYEGDRGRYAGRLLAAARQARTRKRGLWGACRTTWNPLEPAATYRSGRKHRRLRRAGTVTRPTRTPAYLRRLPISTAPTSPTADSEFVIASPTLIRIASTATEMVWDVSDEPPNTHVR